MICNMSKHIDQYSIGLDSDMDEPTKSAFENAAHDGANWVLKPQREGKYNHII